MLNLIKSDLYRITRPRGLRGSLWQYGLVLALIYLAYATFFLVLKIPQVSANLAASGITMATMTEFSTPTQCIASMTGNLTALCATFMTVELALADLKSGFAKSVLSARTGRLSYVAGKIAFAGVVSAIVIALASALVGLCCIAVGATFTGADTLAGTLAWLAGFWLNTWALCVLSLIMVYATRISPVCYIVAFCLCFSTFPQLLLGLAHSSGGILSFLEPIAPALETLAAWMPSSALSNLGAGGQIVLSTSIDIWSASSRALTIDPAPQAVLTGIIWIAAAGALVLAIARRRDV